MTPETLGLAAMLYVALMFLLAHAADRAAARGRWRWMDRPVIYTLSLSIYCSAWTFYGAVGYATRSGLEFLTPLPIEPYERLAASAGSSRSAFIARR